MKHHNETLHALSRRLDPVWWLIARLLRLGREGEGSMNPRSILLVDLHLLGDLVMLVPLLRVIRRCHPHAHVGLMAGPWGRTILENTGLVDEFITLRAPWIAKAQGVAGSRGLLRAIRASRARAWDWGIDVRGDVRNALLLALARAGRRVAYDFSGGAALLTDVVPDDGVFRHIIEHHAALAHHLGMMMTPEEKIPKLSFPEKAASPAPRTSRLIGFHFGASMLLRRMPLEEACTLVLSFQDQVDTRLVLVDAPDTRGLNDALLQRLANGAARIQRWEGSLPQLMQFLATLDKFYAMDSGPAHLAAALGVDTTVFFGPHISLAVRPLGPNVTVVERQDVPCRPCDQQHCTNPSYQECLRRTVCLAGPAQSRDASIRATTHRADPESLNISIAQRG